MRIFLTGGNGWIGSAVVPELLDAGHAVTALARSEKSAQALRSMGAEVVSGSLDDVDTLSKAAAAADGVLHLAFRHDLAFAGDFGSAVATDRQAIQTLGDALRGSERPLVIASGLAGQASGTVVDENDRPDPDSPAGARTRSEQLALSLADSGVRTVSVRLAPTVHGAGDTGFTAALVDLARRQRISGYPPTGGNTWPAVHRLDAARLFRLALESAAPGTVLHGVDEQGVPLRDIAEVIGGQLHLPVRSVAVEEIDQHFGWLAGFVQFDVQASSALTRELVGWQPSHPGLLADLRQDFYFQPAQAA